MKKIEKSIDIEGKKLTLTCGEWARQANAAVCASLGETVVLATVVSAEERDLDYFPLTVEYQEKLYAGGRIKGSRWVKREGRPSDDEILTARLVDRSIRPLFPKSYRRDIQVIITVLSVDLENNPQVAAGVAASAALAVSNIPWGGPVGFIQVGLKGGKYTANPTASELEASDANLFVSTKNDAIVMIEAGANQIAEKQIIGAIEYAKENNHKIIALIKDLVKEAGVKKEKYTDKKISSEITKKLKVLTKGKFKELISGMATKKLSYSDYDELKAQMLEGFDEVDYPSASEAFEDLFKKEIRKMILSGKRPDGRKADEIRELSSQASVLPRTHGSAVFQRGQTQALSIATLGAPSLEQFIETAEGEETKRYIHHYAMPPYSTGETGRVGYPSRREIGHGALAERALLPVIPTKENFPYMIQVVTEILSSNGSTSMASTCGSTLSLMDAGVPISAPIAGIAMGLVIEDEKKQAVLTDIVGIEDGNGDMDFKVAGSKEGITALQLDVKTLKLTVEMLKKALTQAKEARLKILKVMESAISKPKDTVSDYAPKIKTLTIDKEKIGELIGPGGKTIKAIIASTGAQVDVDDDGTVFVSAETEKELQEAVDKVEAIVKDPQPGEIYEGLVKKIQPFGVFVEILPDKVGLVHVSDISEEYVKDPADMFKVGDKTQVRVKGIDDLGRLNLSMMLDPESDRKKEEMRKRNKRTRTSPKKGRDRSYNQRRNSRSKGPHFPTSRFVEDSRKKSR
jgi:polyribonucleotide nucleotidyltransferase